MNAKSLARALRLEARRSWDATERAALLDHARAIERRRPASHLAALAAAITQHGA